MHRTCKTQPRPCSRIKQMLLKRGAFAFVLGCLLFFSCPAPGHAQAPGDPEKRDLVIRMLMLTGGMEIGVETAAKVFDSFVPIFEKKVPGRGQEIADIIKQESMAAFREMQFEIEDEIIDIYVRKFTADELREMLAFYMTPIGAKTLRLLPAMMRETTEISMRFAEKAQKIATPRIHDRLRAVGLTGVKG